MLLAVYQLLNDRIPLPSDIFMAVTFFFSLFAVTEAKYYNWGMDVKKMNLQFSDQSQWRNVFTALPGFL
jgi:hypothetical protein